MTPGRSRCRMRISAPAWRLPPLLLVGFLTTMRPTAAQAAAVPGDSIRVGGPANPAPRESPLAAAPAIARGRRREVFREDRLAHASLAMGLGVGIGMLSREPAVGAGTVIALGLAKEFSDDHIDRGDLAAGALGAGIAVLIVVALTR